MSGPFLVNFVQVLGNILYFALIARVLLSWVNLGPGNPLVVIVHQVTEPILAPIRRVMPKFGMLDFSPMVAMILVFVVQRVLISLFT